MTLGEKIKKARIENGLTQEQLACKMMVSRQAITKWESEKGIPDISNLKLLAQLLNVSVDYLLDDGKEIDINVIRETIDMSKYGKAIIKKKLTDKIVREKYPSAEIRQLFPQKKSDKVDIAFDLFVDFFTPFCGFSDLQNSIRLLLKGMEYYIVNDNNMQFFVSVNYKEGYIESRRMPEVYNTKKGTKFTIGDIVFTDSGVLKHEAEK
ncbi:MAG: helix-turn-helix domain-containing protein [Clostridia bacterium]|nr:helix-turn-helix domain-containing protein [Clostridia bacterium]